MLSRRVGWRQLCNRCGSPFVGASYDVIQSSICGQVGELDIPLCRMVPMTAVRSPLRSDVEKLKAEFVTGYRPGSACFYVSLKSFSLIKKHVQPADC